MNNKKKSGEFHVTNKFSVVYFFKYKCGLLYFIMTDWGIGYPSTRVKPSASLGMNFYVHTDIV